MHNTRYWLWELLVVLGLVFLGCATSGTDSMTPQVQGPQTLEQLLSAAGFKQIYPSTPAQKAKLSNMPQKQIFLISRGPKVYYVYADASGCGCLYAGNQEKYQNFMNLATQRSLPPSATRPPRWKPGAQHLGSGLVWGDRRNVLIRKGL